MTSRHDNASIVAIFNDEQAARKALEDLDQAGFDVDQVGMLTRQTEERPQGKPTMGTGAATGMLVGASLGGLVTGAAPLAMGGGVLAAFLSGSLTGGLVGALIDLGIPEEDAHFYDRELASGRILITVISDRLEEAQALLSGAGATKVSPEYVREHRGSDS